jgi:hypothetical protein
VGFFRLTASVASYKNAYMSPVCKPSLAVYEIHRASMTGPEWPTPSPPWPRQPSARISPDDTPFALS